MPPYQPCFICSAAWLRCTSWKCTPPGVFAHLRMPGSVIQSRRRFISPAWAHLLSKMSWPFALVIRVRFFGEPVASARRSTALPMLSGRSMLVKVGTTTFMPSLIIAAAASALIILSLSRAQRTRSAAEFAIAISLRRGPGQSPFQTPSGSARQGWPCS